MKKKIVSSFILVLLTLTISAFWITTAKAAPPRPWPGDYQKVTPNNTGSIGNFISNFLEKYGILDKFKLISNVPADNYTEGMFDAYYDNYFTPTVSSLLAKGNFSEDLDLTQKLLDARVSFTINDIKYYAGKNEIRLLVLFNNKDLDQTTISSVVSASGGQLNKIFNIIPLASVYIPRDKIALLTTNMRNIFDIKSIGMNSPVYTQLDQSVPMIFEPGTENGQKQWIEEKWAHGPIDGKGVIVAILDTGINDVSPDLNDLDDIPTTNDPKVIFKKNTTYAGLLSDDNGHGTHVASILAGTGQASNGKFVGVAPKAKLYNIKVLDNEGSAETSMIIDGIDWAVNGPDGLPPAIFGANDAANIISMSLSAREFPYAYSDAQVEAVEAATAKGIVVVVAAGNYGMSGYSTVGTPGRAPNVITVGAVDKLGVLASFSSTGPSPISPFFDSYETPYLVKPDVVAPGVDICAIKTGGYLNDNNYYSMICDSDKYGALSGTSMATPHVAGAAALMLQMHPRWTPAQVKSALVQMAKPMTNSEGDYYNVFEQGAGLIVVGDSLRFGGEVVPPVINAGVYDLANPPSSSTIEINFEGRNDNQNDKCYGLKIGSIETTNVDEDENPDDLWVFPSTDLRLKAMQTINFSINRIISDLTAGRYATRMQIEYYEACDFSFPEPTKVLQLPISFYVKSDL
jgi:subtilisin family serine protease